MIRFTKVQKAEMEALLRLGVRPDLLEWAAFCLREENDPEAIAAWLDAFWKARDVAWNILWPLRFQHKTIRTRVRPHFFLVRDPTGTLVALWPDRRYAH